MTLSFPRAMLGASTAWGGCAALFLAAWLSGCGGSPGGATVPDLSEPEPGLVLAQDSAACSADPGTSVAVGISCTVTIAVRPPAHRLQNNIDWTEQPSTSGSKVVADVDRSIQPDGSWLVTIAFKARQAAGPHTGAIDLVPFDLVGTHVPARLNYTFTMNGADGTLSPLKPLTGGRDWTTFGGNAAHTGAVAATLDVARFSRRWTRGNADTGMFSSIATSQGRIYTSTPPVEPQAPYRVWSFNESDGTVAWSFGEEFPFDPPAAGSGLVFLSQTETLTALHASTGSLAYRRHHTAQPLPSLTSSRLAPTPDAADVFSGNGGEGQLVRHDASTGEVTWTAKLRNALEDPAFQDWAPAATGDLVLTNVLGVFNAFERTDGSKRFSIPVPGKTGGSGLTLHPANQAPVVVNADSVLLLDQRSTDGSPVANTLTMIDMPSRSVRWSAEGQFTTHPVSGNGVVYVANHASQRLEALSADTGEPIWTWGVTGGGATRFKDLLLTDNLLFISAGNTTYAVDLASRQAVWSYPAAGSLALSSNGVLYIVTGSDDFVSNHLIAINVH